MTIIVTAGRIRAQTQVRVSNKYGANDIDSRKNPDEAPQSSKALPTPVAPVSRRHRFQRTAPPLGGPRRSGQILETLSHRS